MAQVKRPNSSAGLVSVIIPFFNTRASFLREAVDSVFSQTYGNWELILVDDGSDVRISEAAKRIADEHSGKVRYIEHFEHQNLGISASRNAGVFIANGDYIAFLDADDVWCESQLEEQIDLLQSYPRAAMLYGNTTYWRSWQVDNEIQDEDFHYDLGVPTGQIIEPPELLRRILQRRAVPPCMTCIIARRQIFDDGVVFEDTFREHYEDQVFVAKVAASYPVFVSDKRWGKYRQHAESVTADGDYSDKALAWRLKYLQWMSNYLAGNEIRDRSLWLSLRLELLMLRDWRIEFLVRVLRSFLRRSRKIMRVFLPA